MIDWKKNKNNNPGVGEFYIFIKKKKGEVFEFGKSNKDIL